MRALPDADYLRQLLDYDPETGIFLWRIRPIGYFSDVAKGGTWNTRYAGKEAGTISANGYRLITVDRVHLMAHRIAWAIAHGNAPPQDIDHIDSDRANNCISNLRPATRAENLANSRKKTTFGTKGVWFDATRGKFQAQITHLYKQYHLGRFDTLEQAVAARREAAERLQGKFARHE